MVVAAQEDGKGIGRISMRQIPNASAEFLMPFCPGCGCTPEHRPYRWVDYYLGEFTFRFNRRRSKNRGKLFYRLAQQAVVVDPVTLDQILHPDARKPQPLTHNCEADT